MVAEDELDASEIVTHFGDRRRQSLPAPGAELVGRLVGEPARRAREGERRPARLSAPQPLHRTGGLIAGDRHDLQYLAKRRLAYGGVLPHVSSESACRIYAPLGPASLAG